MRPYSVAVTESSKTSPNPGALPKLITDWIPPLPRVHLSVRKFRIANELSIHGRVYIYIPKSVDGPVPDIDVVGTLRLELESLSGPQR